jgi:hypothetical protein
MAHLLEKAHVAPEQVAPNERLTIDLSQCEALKSRVRGGAAGKSTPSQPFPTSGESMGKYHKVFGNLKRPDGMSFEDFKKWWQEVLSRA